MRYLRSWIFNAGLALSLAGAVAAVYLAKDMIGLWLAFTLRRWSEEGGGGGGAIMNFSGFMLAVLVALIGLAILVAGAIRVWHGR